MVIGVVKNFKAFLDLSQFRLEYRGAKVTEGDFKSNYALIVFESVSDRSSKHSRNRVGPTDIFRSLIMNS